MSDTRYNIFIIDDDQEITTALNWFFDSTFTKYKLDIYNRAKSFLEIYSPTLKGCIVLDLLMPEMNGFELLDILNKRNNKMPILALSGNGNSCTASKAFAAGASEFILKPINCDLLLLKIENLLAQTYNSKISSK